MMAQTNTGKGLGSLRGVMFCAAGGDSSPLAGRVPSWLRLRAYGFVVGVLLAGAALGQAPAPPAAAAPGDAVAAPSTRGTVVDQVVAVVNGDLVLESDVDEERRLAAFQPFTDKSEGYNRAKTINRLVDRALILQQEKLQPQQPITDSEVEAQWSTLRKDIPACKQYHCETDAGWRRFIEAQGFTEQELMDRWRERMQVLRFVEQRFKMGIRITAAQIQTYYDKTLLPEYAKQGATAPKLATISDRIQEILLQQQVGALLEDWLQSLKAQGSVRMTRAGEGRP